MCPDAAQNLDAGHAGHHHVQHHELVGIAQGQGQPFLAAMGQTQVQAFQSAVFLKQGAKFAVAVDHEDDGPGGGFVDMWHGILGLWLKKNIILCGRHRGMHVPGL